KPVETILSGPAASSIGGRFLSGQSGALVIDVGGTTTDMALIENSQIAVSNEGARVGDIETAVKAAKIRTACVGCDSRISFISSHEFQVGPDRVVPLSRLASLYPEVERELNNLSNKRSSTLNIYDIEYWHLSKQIDIESHSLIDRNIRADLIKLLQARPLSLTYILAQLNVHHPVQLNADTLIQQGIIERVTLTPTDLLHANGQLNIWNTDCARFILDHVCKIYRWQQGAFIEEVLNRIVSTMVEESVIFLARQDLGLRLPEGIDGSWGRWFFDEGLEEKNNYLSVNISSRFPIIGIGAPANIFIKKVADILHTRFILPSHPHVANAVGAVAGSVIVEKEAIIYVQETQDKRVFIVRFEGETSSFKQSEDAFVYAEKMALKSARHGANEAGAVDPQVQVQRLTEGALQRIQVRAVGNPRLSEEWGTVNN
ncbi:MAG TPA: hydantoinase/oxoprolinase family protein, partial [Desulfohalobiaceae bacterium]|nr:hydantoinase/oxoprolinase family protein [Desulfohalobiaceae bacterium]